LGPRKLSDAKKMLGSGKWPFCGNCQVHGSCQVPGFILKMFFHKDPRLARIKKMLVFDKNIKKQITIVISRVFSKSCQKATSAKTKKQRYR
jgi:hypothetical protein